MRIGIKSYLHRCLESDLREHNAVPFADTISGSSVKSQNSNNIQSMENECSHHASMLN